MRILVYLMVALFLIAMLIEFFGHGTEIISISLVIALLIIIIMMIKDKKNRKQNGSLLRKRK